MNSSDSLDYQIIINSQVLSNMLTFNDQDDHDNDPLDSTNFLLEFLENSPFKLVVEKSHNMLRQLHTCLYDFELNDIPFLLHLLNFIASNKLDEILLLAKFYIIPEELINEIDENLLTKYMLLDLAIQGDHNYFFLACCQYEYINMAKWLYGHKRINSYFKNGVAFPMVCSNNNLEFAQWLFDLDLDKNDIWKYFDEAFDEAFEKRYYPIMEWLYSFDVITNEVKITLFRKAFETAEQELISWIFNRNDFFIDNYKCFLVNDYFFSRDKYDRIINVQKEGIHLNIYIFFRLLCKERDLEIVKWCYNLGYIIDDKIVAITFFDALKGTKISLAKWLYSLGKVDINAHRNNETYRFYLECYTGEDREWLLSLG